MVEVGNLNAKMSIERRSKAEKEKRVVLVVTVIKLGRREGKGRKLFEFAAHVFVHLWRRRRRGCGG